MNKIKCLIIDDEPHAASILEAYISELESLELVGVFYHAVDALMYLQRHKIDLLFLDVMLPKVTGDAFLRLLPARPKVIFLSNKRKRWSRGGDDHILDLLVKPVAFEAFLEGIERYYATVPPLTRRAIQSKAKKASRNRGPFIYLFSGKVTVKIFLDEVLYIEGVKNYVKFRTTEREIVVHQGMTAIESRMAEHGFMRIHRSLIVATDKITAFGDTTIEIGAHILPVSAPYREKVQRLSRAAAENV
ncbi:LytTR family DNA-binding domain-containing protein [Dyadobacter sp. 676]|uniref:LytTR family DNA-binding domain-containing protein n=1 Tax=Dyadobacter sp. 676 TaxID=3088362 RepID=A0AAU8FJ94_9BACT